MASAWGKSWGRAWGNSWGSVATETPSGGSELGRWFDYPDRRRRDEEQEESAELVIAPVPAFVSKPAAPLRKLTRADIDAARKWADGLSQQAIALPSIQGFEAAYAFSADERLTEDEAVALVLLLSET